MIMVIIVVCEFKIENIVYIGFLFYNNVLLCKVVEDYIVLCGCKLYYVENGVFLGVIGVLYLEK